MSAGRVVVVVPARSAPGYRLAGVRTVVADTAGAAAEAVRGLLAAERGVVAVAEPFWPDLPAGLRREAEERLVPLVIRLPVGSAGDLVEERGAALRSLVAAAVGYEFTFDVQEGQQ